MIYSFIPNETPLGLFISGTSDIRIPSKINKSRVREVTKNKNRAFIRYLKERPDIAFFVTYFCTRFKNWSYKGFIEKSNSY